MTRTLAIASTTLREALRERLFHNLLVFAVLLVAGSLTISQLTLGEQYRIIADIGTSATQVFGTLIAVFLGVGLLSKEIDRRTCYAALARPVSRASFVLGKFLGLFVTLALNVTVMALATAAVLLSYRGLDALTWAYLATFVLIALQLAICGAFAVLFSTFTTATLSSILTLALVGAGWVFAEVRHFWLHADDLGLKPLVRVLDFVLPNMALLDLKETITYGDAVSLGSVLTRGAYGVCYSATLLLVAAVVFTRRDVR